MATSDVAYIKDIMISRVKRGSPTNAASGEAAFDAVEMAGFEPASGNIPNNLSTSIGHLIFEICASVVTKIAHTRVFIV